MIISIVIPCYRSEKTVSSVIDEIVLQMKARPECDFEIIAVNDQSPDHVLDVLRDYADKRPYLKVIDLAKNMGKHAALMAGYAHSNGDVVVNLDDDGQCPIDRLWDLLQPLEQEFDVAFAAYPQKKESSFKQFGSKVNDLMARMLIGKPKGLQISNFCAMKRFVVDEILHYHNPYPYIDGLILRTTNKIANIAMEERSRTVGTSGYTLRKSLALWINGFTAFSVKPLRIADMLGVLTALIGFVFTLFIVVRKIFNPNIVIGYSSTMAVMLFIGGMLMLLLGIVGEYIGRIYISLNNAPQYVIRETVNVVHDKKADWK